MLEGNRRLENGSGMLIAVVCIFLRQGKAGLFVMLFKGAYVCG